MKKPRRVSWPVLLAVLTVIGILFAVKNGSIRDSIAQMSKEESQSRVQLSSEQRVTMNLESELAMSGTDEYIENQARTRFGYLKPGELRFVITNPEALYGSVAEVPILTVVAQGAEP